ncbi:SIS domain-containing protein [Alsobacter sp. SYSU M60028]|uniref:SIS domain-containing protein n=1 Tax=Alsobacter ponti TaxID=2962936 RepID=A0ABT1L7M7_9HYPH|nr:SIS domain-containing protein [Alsobacter ponti]MCP8936966.1 SIS domain-containing protein [Alsobacter ponti]
MTTAMARETFEIPDAAERLLADAGPFAAAAAALARHPAPFAVICGRGSSGHAGVYLRYLIETRLGIVVSHTAPSVVTNYRKSSAMRGALFVVISQSGRSPDLVAATEAARESGALTLALVNVTASPVAEAAQLVVPLHAGPELAVAATKSVVSSMLAGARLVAEIAGDAELSGALVRSPERLRAALALDWQGWREALPQARAAFVAARGYGFGPAREIALKLSETLRLPALGYSAAELRHGPRAAIDRDTPVLALRQHDATAETVDGLVDDLRAAGESVFLAGGERSALPWIGDDHPACDPVAMLVPAYLAIERAARAMGLDPDSPPFLKKVTETL